MAYLRHQFFITTDWAGGIYASATLLGSRSGGPIAAAWAAMNSLGQQRYLELADQVMKGVDQLREVIQNTPELELVGSPCMNILAFKTLDGHPDIFVVADALAAKGWYVDRQQRPNCIHVTVMPQNLPVMEGYISDLLEAVAFAKANPKAKAEGNAALYGLMARIPFRGMVAQNVRKMFETLYGSPVDEETNAEPEPEKWMGWMNRLLSSRLFRRRK
jgi:glutamate/tyrosine decarboxylase-like PLP-dependent enzyme